MYILINSIRSIFKRAFFMIRRLSRIKKKVVPDDSAPSSVSRCLVLRNKKDTFQLLYISCYFVYYNKP